VLKALHKISLRLKNSKLK